MLKFIFALFLVISPFMSIKACESYLSDTDTVIFTYKDISFPITMGELNRHYECFKKYLYPIQEVCKKYGSYENVPVEERQYYIDLYYSYLEELQTFACPEYMNLINRKYK